MVSRHWLYFGGFVITGILLVGVGLLGVVDALSVLSGGTTYGEEFVLIAMLGEAAEWVFLALVLGLFAAVFLLAAAVSVLRSASLPRDDRLVAVVERLEREYPLLRQFDVKRTVEPTKDDRKRRLKERYVSGEISEATFERELAQLLDETDSEAESRSEDETSVEIRDRS